jgi:hypothetical protein
MWTIFYFEQSHVNLTLDKVEARVDMVGLFAGTLCSVLFKWDCICPVWLSYPYASTE